MIHNGIDVEHYVDHYTSEEKKIYYGKATAFPSLITWLDCAPPCDRKKAHGDLLKAIANLRVAGLDIKCLFIGDGSERLRIEEAIKTMGLAQHVKITGFLADARPAMATCNVMALVSHHVETFSLAALEAMALGKPMIMSEIGGAAEQVIHGEKWIPV
ncbi:glycosyltransferase [Undibacterium arcticum]